MESWDRLSPGPALARFKELVAATAPDLSQVKFEHTSFFYVSISPLIISPWLCVLQAFMTFDPSGTGTVTAPETLCGRLSDEQHRILLPRLDREDATANWKDFLKRLQSRSPEARTDHRERRPPGFWKLSGSLHLHGDECTDKFLHIRLRRRSSQP